MKKYIIKIAVFFVVVLFIDQSIGMICDFLNAHAKGGYTKKVYYTTSLCNEDVIIMGSSRANHHYNPDIISDSLGLNAYNAGIDGSGIILMKGFYELMCRHHIPKFIIYDVTQSFDIYEYAGDSKNTRYLSQLKPYFRESSVKSIVKDVSPIDNLLLYSGCYRFNTSCINLIKNYLKKDAMMDNGFSPLFGSMNYKVENKANEYVSTNIDSLKMRYMSEFIDECNSKGTQLILVVSPQLGGDVDSFNPIFELAKQKNIPLFDFYHDEGVCHKKYFKDTMHLNLEGANLFSSLVAMRIIKLKKLKLSQ